MVATWVVMAASYEARAFGIHSAMHATEARRLCPEVVAVEPRSEAYAEASEALFAVFEAASPVVERHGIEEAFLEGPPSLGRAAAGDVRREVGLPVTVGVAEHEDRGEDGQPRGQAGRAADRDDEPAFLHAHRVEQLWGIGKATAATLHARGIATVGEAAALSLAGADRPARHRQRPPRARAGQQPRPRAGPAARPRRAFGSTRSLGARRPPAGGARAGRGAGRRAIARDRRRRPDGHAPPALRRPHDGDPLAHLPAAVDDATVIGATAAALVDTDRPLTRIGVSVSSLEVADSLRLWTT